MICPETPSAQELETQIQAAREHLVSLESAYKKIKEKKIVELRSKIETSFSSRLLYQIEYNGLESLQIETEIWLETIRKNVEILESLKTKIVC